MPGLTVGGHIREHGSLLAVAEKRARIDGIMQRTLSEDDYVESLRQRALEKDVGRTVAVDEALLGDASHHSPPAILYADS